MVLIHGAMAIWLSCTNCSNRVRFIGFRPHCVASRRPNGPKNQTEAFAIGCTREACKPRPQSTHSPQHLGFSGKRSAGEPWYHMVTYHENDPNYSPLDSQRWKLSHHFPTCFPRKSWIPFCRLCGHGWSCPPGAAPAWCPPVPAGGPGSLWWTPAPTCWPSILLTRPPKMVRTKSPKRKNKLTLKLMIFVFLPMVFLNQISKDVIFACICSYSFCRKCWSLCPMMVLSANWRLTPNNAIFGGALNMIYNMFFLWRLFSYSLYILLLTNLAKLSKLIENTKSTLLIIIHYIILQNYCIWKTNSNDSQKIQNVFEINPKQFKHMPNEF